MAKKNLLAIVQDILNDMDGDEVNAISDTLESQQVAQIVKSTYEDLYNEKRWPIARELIQLTSHATTARPTHFTLPEAVSDIDFIKYNIRSSTDTKDEYADMEYMEPKDFLDLVTDRDSSATEIDSVTDVSGITLFIYNDREPTYWTSFDDENIIFDAYDSAVSTTLTSAKTQAYVAKEPTFTVSDSFIPDLPAKAFSLFINECKSAASNKLRQIEDITAASRARRQRTIMARDKHRIGGGIKYPDYGRK